MNTGAPLERAASCSSKVHPGAGDCRGVAGCRAVGRLARAARAAASTPDRTPDVTGSEQVNYKGARRLAADGPRHIMDLRRRQVGRPRYSQAPRHSNCHNEGRRIAATGHRAWMIGDDAQAAQDSGCIIPMMDRSHGSGQSPFRSRPRTERRLFRNGTACDGEDAQGLGRRRGAARDGGKTGLQDPGLLQELRRWASRRTPRPAPARAAGADRVGGGWRERRRTEADRPACSCTRHRGGERGGTSPLDVAVEPSRPGHLARAWRLIQAMLDAPAGDHSLSATIW